MEKNFFDNAFDKAKTAFEAAYKKTGEIVSVEKLKFNLTSLKSKRAKLYGNLGKEYFSRVNDVDSLPEKEKSLFEEITEINSKIDDIIDEINYVKSKRVCPNCGAAIEEKSVYCNFCGEKVTFDTDNEDEAL